MSIGKRWAIVSIAYVVAACGGGGSEGPVTAEDCFDATTFARGMQISQKLDRGTRVDWRVASEVSSYNGFANVLKVSNNVVWEEGMPGIHSYYSELYIDPLSSPQITSYGTYYVGGSGLLRVELSEIYSQPFTDKRFTLKEGESLEYKYSGIAREVSLFGPGAGTNVTEFTKSGSVKFEGLEPITIGDRSVQACKFVDGATMAWYYRGLQVQYTDSIRPIANFRTVELTRDGEAY